MTVLRLPVLALVMMVMALGVAAPAAADEPGVGSIKSRGDDDTISLDGWRQTGGGHGARRPAAASAKPRFIQTYVPACEGNSPTRSETVLCGGALALCADTAESTEIGYWVFTAPAGTSNWTSTGAYVCLGRTEPGEPRPIVPVLTAEDFRRLPLLASPIVVQPPNRRTLVNIPTNLYTDGAVVTLPTELLGQPVRVRAEPYEFRWSYGDGDTRITSDAGAPYPELRTAHVYLEAGPQRVELTTIFRGEYSVAGGPWLPVDGTASVDSPGSTLEVLTAETRLVS
ncbi:hypothetical protein [Kineosporia succinea]|uniref:PKD domain-containing protein n=1 Tax=Kineosporia succinea TaxID=84632 RepID=A0ABT9NYZ7_9ACTN|nr:hypothetical protein [Kineosporia succinea]MDP9825664.1 hypothetical protein [Kineosporia succinea]